MPFTVHQALEYALAAVLAWTAVHVAHGTLLLIGASVFALLALTARGPLAVARLCGSTLHATLDVVAALALAAAPAVPALRPAPIGLVAVEIAALGWLRLATLTRYRRTPAADGTAARDGTAATSRSTSAALSTGAGPGGAGPVGPTSPEPPGRAGPGPATRAGSGRPLPLGAALAGGARRAGRHTGRLQQAWRRIQDGRIQDGRIQDGPRG